MFFFKSGFSSDTRPLEVAANASIVLDVTLRDISGIVSGTVSDSQTTRPIAGAGVIAFNGDPFIAIEGGMGEGEPGGGANGLASRRLQMRPPAPPTAGGISLFPPVRYFDETNEQGGYEIVVEEGDYTVVAFARGHQEQAQNTSVTAGQQQTVNFQLAPGGDEGGGGGGGLPVPLRFMSRR
jgi:hypothetical protein